MNAERIETLQSEILRLEKTLEEKKQELSLLEKETESSETILERKINNSSRPEEKIALFRSLFHGREDVYAKRFESKKTGKAGYQPVCANEWAQDVCRKPTISCQSEYGDLALVAGKAPDAVICLLSALRFHGLTTQAASEVWIALQNKTWRPHIDYPAIQITRFSPNSWAYGVSEHNIVGIPVKMTSVEKTIADCFKFRNKVAMDVAIEALKDAKSKKAINWDELWRCAKVDRITGIIRPYMEALA